MNTTQTDPIPRWWAMWVALLLLVFGVPSLAARVVSLRSDSIHQELIEGRSVSYAELDVLDADRRSITRWFHDNSSYGDVVLVALARAMDAPADKSDALYHEAEAWQVKALTASPADAYGWYRLAYLYYMIDRGPTPRVEAAWLQSMSSAPYEPRLALPRLQMGLSLGARKGVDHTPTLKRLVQQAWTYSPEDLSVAAREQHFISLVEDVLRDNVEATERFHNTVRDYWPERPSGKEPSDKRKK